MNEEELFDEEDEDGEIIELIDDDGKVIKFKLFDVTEYKGEKYTILLPAEEAASSDDGDVVIFRFNEKEETLEPIEDEALLDEVFEFYTKECEEDE